jgi:hypothetical protein
MNGRWREPLVSVCLVGMRRHFAAGEEIEAEYQIDAVSAEEIRAVEAAILWCAEGKGDDDLGVHFFERRLPADAEEGDLTLLRRFRVQLPLSPLSYRGALMTIRWCVRVRLFLRNGKEYVAEQPFTIGSVPTAVAIEPPPSTDATSSEKPAHEFG